jgi:topoisomerase-4 subunit B
VGLNGVGTKAVNALSSDFEVCSWRDGAFRRARFGRGRLLEQRRGRETGVRLEYYAFLNTGLTLSYNGRTFRSRAGLADLLGREIGAEQPLYDVVHCRVDRLEFAFTHTHNYGETYFSFVNGQYTNDGGTHQAAFREAILKAVNEYAERSFAGEDVRDGIVGAVAVKVQDPVFESQTKNKLGSTEVRPWILKEVKEQLLHWLHRNAAAAEALLEKVKSNERVRKELAEIKKEARERARKVAIRIPKLIDCKTHYDDGNAKRREETMIFLTEGDSAGGAMIQARDVETQAIFTLKGKPLNTYGLKRDVVYRNEEMYNIMRALGIEEGIDGLRYNKVVIATDADVDGMHIRNLLITFFLRYFEDLVHHEHLYILETPLFRVRNRQETRYCYSETERDRAMAELRGAEVTRFKGLGEISPSEFGQFISGSIRLVSVSLGSLAEAAHCLEFFMGKNTPERREFIVENLLREVL